MPRLIGLILALPLLAQAASLQDHQLSQQLQQIAQQSSQGTPRAINEDILDQGYTAEGHELINHLSVRAEHAANMRANPDVVRAQLTSSVCSNPGFRRLLANGATLRYEFSEYRTNRPVTRERFSASDCQQP